MHVMLLPLAVLFVVGQGVLAITITTTVSAQPQAPATSVSAAATASTSAIRNVGLPMTSPFSNATAPAPTLASGCSPNCTFTVPVENKGSWKRCDSENEIYFAGQVKHIVDRLKNTTMTTTIYAGKITYSISGTVVTAEASDVMNNGSFKYSRTDVNEAGTVTKAVFDRISSMQYELAYPTAARDFGRKEYAWEGVLPYAANGTTECITATPGLTPFPTEVILPTRQVGKLDSEDPRGLSYCYDYGHTGYISDDFFWSLFNGTILEALHNESNCELQVGAWAPVGVASQATFLLETITDYVDGSETKSPAPSPSTKADPTPTDVLEDPFRIISQSDDEQKPSPSKSDTKPSPTEVPASPTIAEPVETRSEPLRTTSATEQSQQASVSPADQSIAPSDDEDNFELSQSRGKNPTAPANKASESRVAEPTASANKIQDSVDQTDSAPKASQLDILNSLIQDVGQQQSSVGHTAPAGNKVPTLTLEGITATPDSSSKYLLGEQTLEAGGPAITISGTQISLGSGASVIVVDSSTSILVASDSPGDREQADYPTPVVTLTAHSKSASEYVVGDQTIKPGGPAITVSGTLISLDPQATAAIVGSSTRPVATVQYGGNHAPQGGVQSAGKPASILTLAGIVATLNSASEYMIAGQTLKPGGTPITLSGTPISLASQATAAIVGSSTSILATAPHPGDQAQQVGELATLLTLAGATAALNSASEYVVQGQTLTPGENAITLSGTRISLAPDATAVVIGSSTSALPAASSSGIGDYVWAGIAGVLAATEASSTALPGASETESGSEVIVTSTASDGGVVVKTIFTVEPTPSSPVDFSSSTAGTSPLASDETPSPPGTSDVASVASSTVSAANVAALIFSVAVFMTFGM